MRWVFMQNDTAAFQDVLNYPERYFSSDELGEYGRFTVPKRRMEWLFSRWVVKNLVSQTFDRSERPALRDIHVKKEAGGVPFAEVAGLGRLGWLSLSHSHHGVLAAFSRDPAARFGVDLEYLEPRSPELLEDFFTPSERDWVTRLQGKEKILASNLIWSAKEAFLKALEKGLQIDTRRVEIQPCELKGEVDGWRALQFLVNGQESPPWRLLFRSEANYVMTLCLPAAEISKLS